jgi:lipid-A-disaccharide synthase
MEAAKAPLRLFISAGELSGDVHAARLVDALAKRAAKVDVVALGSDNLKAAGAKVLYDTARGAALGVIGNLLQAPLKLSQFNAAVRCVMKDKPDAVILIDSRFFNLNLARVLREKGYQGAIVYYVAPVMWQAASDERYRNIALQPEQFRKNTGRRFEEMRKNIDLALVIYPVGLELYEYFGINYEFVGHPLCETVKPSLGKNELRALAGARDGAPLIGLMPGSRKEEVSVIGRELIGAANIISRQIPTAAFALPVAHPSLRKHIQAMLKGAAANITLLEPERRFDLIAHADLMVVASGTATHECAAAGTPHIMAYRLQPVVDFFYANFTRFRLPAYAFPNIIAGRKVIPELIRTECSADNIAKTAMSLLGSAAAMEQMRRDLCDVRSQICKPNSLNRSAELVIEAISRRMG